MALEKSMGVLRSALEGHGLTVERLTVQLQPGANQGGFDPHGGQEKQDAGGHESRGRSQGRQRDDGGPNAEFTELFDDIETGVNGS
jgi:flagellar hook-length control protein FliK